MKEFKEMIEQADNFAARVRATTELVLVLEKKIQEWGMAMEASDAEATA